MTRKIRVLANGGLGNQLFYWNLAHQLEKHYKREVHIVFSKDATDRENELIALTSFCSHNICVEFSAFLMKSMRIKDKFQRRYPKIGTFINNLFKIYSSDLPADPFRFEKNPPNIIRGYFQNVSSVDCTIDLYESEILEVCKIQISKIRAYLPSDYHGIHIRRGDFTQNRQSAGLLSLEYFLINADSRYNSIICTDETSAEEISKIRDNFSNCKILTSKDLDAWGSFSVLFESTKLLLSNSTFSWWAGYLGARRGATVLAPKPWTLVPLYGNGYLDTTLFSYINSRFEE